KDAAVLLLVTFVLGIAPVRHNVVSSPHALGHSADLFCAGRDCAVARPRKAATPSSQATRGTCRATFVIPLDHRVPVGCHSGCRVAGVGTRIYSRAARLGDAEAPRALDYDGARRRVDCHSSVAQPATHGTVGSAR